MSEDLGTPEEVQPPESPEQPATPPSAPEKPPESAPAPASAGGTDENTLALLAHILGIVALVIAPLIIYLMANDKPYTKGQAREALNFQITLLIAYMASWLLAFIMIGFVLLPIVGIYGLVMMIIATMAASRGEDYRYPITLRLVK